MPFAKIDDSNFYYEVAGVGYPLILVHSGLSDYSMWEPQWLDFAKHYRVVRYDLRGMGASSVPTRPYSHVQDLQNLMSYLGIEKAHLLGLSFGGRVALDFTLTFPEMVSALVLASSGVSGAEFSEDVIARWEAIDAAWERGDRELANELELQMWVDGPQRKPDQVDAKLREQLKATNAHNLELSNQKGVAEPVEVGLPALHRLGEIRIPTLALVGDKDIADMQNLYTKLKNEIPGAQAQVIEGAAHFPNLEQPEVFNRLVLNFLALVGYQDQG